MFDFQIATDDKPELYRQLRNAADALTAGEPDSIANMANVAALLWEALPDLNWAGFYRNVNGELVLGPSAKASAAPPPRLWSRNASRM